MSWEERFRELIEYYEINGKWPPQSVGTLGDWVHRQRTSYNLKEEKYMRTKAPRVRESKKIEFSQFFCGIFVESLPTSSPFYFSWTVG